MWGVDFTRITRITTYYIYGTNSHNGVISHPENPVEPELYKGLALAENTMSIDVLWWRFI